MNYNTLTPDQLMSLTCEEVRAIIRQIGYRINALHDQAQGYLNPDIREEHAAEWRSIVQVRKKLYARLQEMGQDAFPTAQAA